MKSATVVALVLALSIAGCGGGDDGDPATTSTETDGGSGDAEGAPDDEGAEGADDEGTDGGDAASDDGTGNGSGGDDADGGGANDQSGSGAGDEPAGDDSTQEGAADGGAVQEALAGGLDEPVQITYRLEGDTAGAEGQEVQEVVLAQAPPQLSWRMEMETGGLRIIFDGEQWITCSDTDAGWQCLAIGSEASSGLQSGVLQMVPTVNELGDMQLPSSSGEETIAGRTGVCYQGADLSGLSEGRVCLDEATGVLLLSEGTAAFEGGGSFRMVATEFGEPGPDAFEPPAEPVDAGSSGQG